jgi:hypothetical protein
MDTLYTVLSISRRSVVLGRYVLALLVYLSLGLVLSLFALARPLLNPGAPGMAESLAGIIAVFVVFSVLQLIQFPILFKTGYTKARILLFLPMIGFGAVAALFFALPEVFGISGEAPALFEWAQTHPLPVLAAGLAVWLGLVLASFKISVLFYEQRDL